MYDGSLLNVAERTCVPSITITMIFSIHNMSRTVLQMGGQDLLGNTISNVVSFIPQLISALIVLIVGWIIGRLLGGLVSTVLQKAGLGRFLQDTPLGDGDGDDRFARVVGKFVKYYIYIFVILTAANILGIQILTQLLSDLLTALTVYAPQLIGGLIVLLVGFWLAEWAGSHVADTDRRRLTDYAGVGLKIFIYYIAITMALQTAGFEASILNNLFYIIMTALFGALAIAFIIAAGVGGALGSKDYIADNIAGWVESAKASVSLQGGDESGFSGESGFESPDEE